MHRIDIKPRVALELAISCRRVDEANADGWVAEWTKAAVLKTALRESVAGVRIPPHPFFFVSSQVFAAILGLVCRL